MSYPTVGNTTKSELRNQLPEHPRHHPIHPHDVLFSIGSLADVGEAEANTYFELLRRSVELSVVGREYYEGLESYEPVRSDSA
jgi:hypothetical protein